MPWQHVELEHIPGFEWTAHQSLVPGLDHLPGFGWAAQGLQLGSVHADTILLSWVCMAAILAGALLVRPALVADGPGGNGQGLWEMIYDFTSGLSKEYIGHDWKKFFPLITAIFIFVLIANFSGILPWMAIAKLFSGWPHEGHELFEAAAPTTDFNVTVGLAMVALITYIASGFMAHGIKYFKHYLNPIEWMDLLIRPATLAIRLMIVISADEILRGATLALVPALLPAGVMGFEMFIAVIQAFVFALLTSIYIGLTVSHH